MSNTAHTQPAERDRVHAEWTPEATALLNEVSDADYRRFKVRGLSESLAKVRATWCGGFPLRVLPEDVRCALAGYGVMDAATSPPPFLIEL